MCHENVLFVRNVVKEVLVKCASYDFQNQSLESSVCVLRLVSSGRAVLMMVVLYFDTYSFMLGTKIKVCYIVNDECVVLNVIIWSFSYVSLG